jgi:hypothetical protein
MSWPRKRINPNELIRRLPFRLVSGDAGLTHSASVAEGGPWSRSVDLSVRVRRLLVGKVQAARGMHTAASTVTASNARP